MENSDHRKVGHRWLGIMAGTLALLASTLALHAKTIILPIEAIADSQYLTAKQFGEQYPGIDITNATPDEEGWYIRYHHENLTYYYGPLDDYHEALKHKETLEQIRLAVIAKRPSLESSEVSLHQFSYDFSTDSNYDMAKEEQGSAESNKIDQTQNGESGSNKNGRGQSMSQTVGEESASNGSSKNTSNAETENSKDQESENESSKNNQGSSQNSFSIFDFFRNLFGF